jgi:hypothetical protein
MNCSPREHATFTRLFVLRFVPFRNLNPAETGFPLRAKLPGFQFPFAKRRLETPADSRSPIFAGDCGKLSTPRKSPKALPCQFSADSGQSSELIGVRWFVFFAFFTPAVTKSVLLAGPTPGRDLGARSKIAPASPFCPFATVTVLAFAGLLNALPRTARCLPHL